MSTATISQESATSLGYKIFTLGRFRFARDQYFAHITHPKGTHIMTVDAFLRCILRDVAWGFFYGTLNFDHVIGTINKYGTVDLFVGLMNEYYVTANRHYVETFDSKELH